MHSLDLDDWTDYRQTLNFIQKPTFLEREIYLCLKYASINDLRHAIVTNPGPEHSALPIADSEGDCYCSGASSTTIRERERERMVKPLQWIVG